MGRRIYRIQPIDGLASQTASAGVILGASLARRADVDDPGRRLVGRRASASGAGAGTTCTGRSSARWASPG